MNNEQKRTYVLAKCTYLYLRNTSNLLYYAEKNLVDKPWILTDPQLGELREEVAALNRKVYDAVHKAEAPMRAAIGISEDEEESIAQTLHFKAWEGVTPNEPQEDA